MKNCGIRYVAVIVIAAFNEKVSSSQLVTVAVLHYTVICLLLRSGQEKWP